MRSKMLTIPNNVDRSCAHPIPRGTKPNVDVDRMTKSRPLSLKSHPWFALMVATKQRMGVATRIVVMPKINFNLIKASPSKTVDRSMFVHRLTSAKSRKKTHCVRSGHDYLASCAFLNMSIKSKCQYTWMVYHGII